jgi:PKD repeat protein
VKKIVAIILPLFIALNLIAQKQGNIWYFGNHAGLDFNTTPPAILLSGQTDFPLPNQWNEGCTSISDSSGSLLFYTNGMKIWNRFHQIMPNGNELLGHSSSTQSSIIVPAPSNQNLFYVFTTDAEENDFQNGLRYNVVDICLDHGRGDVIEEEKNIKLLDTVSERLICIRHSNNIDYWIITHKYNSDSFYSFLLTNSGILDTIISHTGFVDNLGWGQTISSPNGQKIAYCKPGASNGFTVLFDFNNTTGIITNGQILSTLNTEYAVAFSPDNTKLYFSTGGHGELFQYDLNAGNINDIIASKTHIINTGPDNWRQMKLGPDEKIYIARTGKTYLSVIENPNNTYPNCNYIDSAIYLGGQYSSWGLPNLIIGYKYANAVPIACDTCTQTPDVKFNYSDTNLLVNFTDQSGGIFSNFWYWDFGDGAISYEQNPQHTYDTSNSYVVTFIACNNTCCDTMIDTITVTNIIQPGLEESILQKQPFLYQNFPNPFVDETVIDYFLPEYAENAIIIFHDITGKQVKEITLKQEGESSLLLKSSDLIKGLCFYSLMVNDVKIITKKLIRIQ